MRSFKTFLAEQQLPKLPKDPVARDVQARFQGMRQNVISGKPVYSTRGTGRSSSIPTPGGRGMSPAAAEVRRRQLSRGEGLASGEAISTIGPELIVPGGALTAPTRAGLIGGASLVGKGAKNLPKALNFPFGFLKHAPKPFNRPGVGKTLGGAAVGVTGAEQSSRSVRDMANKYLEDQGYDSSLNRGEVFGEFARAIADDPVGMGQFMGSKEVATDFLIPVGKQAALTALTPAGVAATELLAKEPSYKIRKKSSEALTNVLPEPLRPRSVSDLDNDSRSFKAMVNFQDRLQKLSRKKDEAGRTRLSVPSTGATGSDFGFNLD